jgi:NitT/TauT family transport system substrate-binding protein
MKKILTPLILSAWFAFACIAHAEVSEIRVPMGAGGFGFLPLHIMKTNNLVEKHADMQGVKVKVNWSNIGGPSAMMDA